MNSNSSDTGTGRIDQLTVKCLGRIELIEEIGGTYLKCCWVDAEVCTNLRDAVILAERGIYV